MGLFTQEELTITEAFKEIHPWEGQDILDKWQNYLTNLCMINRISAIPVFVLPKNIVESMMVNPGHTMEPPRIYLRTPSILDLLYNFYNFKSEWTNGKEDKEKAVEYSIALFYSVWPKKIKTFRPCPKSKFFKPILLGLDEAIKRNPEYNKDFALCEEHNILKRKHYPSQLHPELN